MAVTRVKLCCMQNADEVAIAVQYGAAAVGLIAATPQVPQSLSEERITTIASRIPPGVASFLITIHRDVPSIIAQQRRCRVNTLQLVDRPLCGTYQELRAALPGVHIVQVIHVTGEETLQEAQSIAPQVDGLVLDSGSRQGSYRERGATGRTHDWHISAQICRTVALPVFLAGGLRPDNVADAIRQVRPYGVDLCSGVRTHGQLDPAKVRAFFDAVHLADKT